MSSQVRLDFFELGDKTSLICADPNTTDVAKATLRDLGFKFHIAEDDPELVVSRVTICVPSGEKKGRNSR